MKTDGAVMSNKDPNTDDVGLTLGGDIKVIYQVTGMRCEVQVDGAILVQAKTECGRVISVLKQGEQNDFTYEVDVSKPNSTESERSYKGKDGSDAHRVYTRYWAAWEKIQSIPGAS